MSARQVWITLNTAALDALRAAAPGGVMKQEARALRTSGMWRVPVEPHVQLALQTLCRRFGLKTYSDLILKMTSRTQ